MPSFFILFVVKMSVVWSKQLQLLRFAFGGALFFAGENFHIAELFVGDAQYSHVAVWGQHIFHAFYVHVSHFFAWAVAQIDGKLKHGETIAHNVLAESGIFFAFLLGFGGKVEEHEDPHNSIFVKSFVHGAPGLSGDWGYQIEG